MLAMFFAYLIAPGIELEGIAGICIAVPVVAVVSVAGRHWLEWRGRDVASEAIVPVEAA